MAKKSPKAAGAEPDRGNRASNPGCGASGGGTRCGRAVNGGGGFRQKEVDGGDRGQGADAAALQAALESPTRRLGN